MNKILIVSCVFPPEPVVSAKLSCDIAERFHSLGKEVVVVIDALDEINGKEREDLLKTINSYAHDNPDMKMVLSCRSNYRRDDQLNAFHELYIESMSIEDVKVHINHKLNVRNTLWQMIGEQELVDFAKQPFFLNVLIDAYREKKVLPKDRGTPPLHWSPP